MLVPKKDPGQWRMCIDFRGVNRNLVDDANPLPKVQDIMDNLEGAQYFSKCDILAAYHNIPLSEESKQYTAFWSVRAVHQAAFRAEKRHGNHAAFLNAGIGIAALEVCRGVRGRLFDLVEHQGAAFERHRLCLRLHGEGRAARQAQEV